MDLIFGPDPISVIANLIIVLIVVLIIANGVWFVLKRVLRATIDFKRDVYDANLKNSLNPGIAYTMGYNRGRYLAGVEAGKRAQIEPASNDQA